MSSVTTNYVPGLDNPVRASAEAILLAIGRVVSGSETPLQEEMRLVDLRRRYDSLTNRERDVMDRVAAGLLNKQVAESLGISEITVKAHRGRVMRKMGSDSIATLVTIAMILRVLPREVSGPLQFAREHSRRGDGAAASAA